MERRSSAALAKLDVGLLADCSRSRWEFVTSLVQVCGFGCGQVGGKDPYPYKIPFWYANGIRRTTFVCSAHIPTEVLSYVVLISRPCYTPHELYHQTIHCHNKVT
ncbi:unnamed protein product [Laminaria digitata]